ncbi:MAG TPA: hypothetical protein DGD08_05260 [Gemmatimonas aurantiaca]|uniref:Uncharacterized protein n=2 Tax=Gemmatimonas aurantiaca TaxID=173480 RepID=C1A6H1_GEMAT|nr:hypothetical protein [Gemmatimonas aurantiaca]BAH37831.1 hypothetical protein GAU_0789 [Gemmatimonas aurantiaca T-27]HCT56607.1 hypothetical protein [Gemmatimonas aurantiaca]
MSTSISAPLPVASRTVTVPVEFFTGLQQAVHHPQGDRAVDGAAASIDAIRDAGYAAGQALFDHFATWLQEQGEAPAADLADERFPWLLEAFLHQQGWGRAELVPLSEAVMALDVSDWSEAGELEGGCLITTGLFAGFFGRLAAAPISVLEVAPPDMAPGRSRFLLGSVDVLEYVWEAMERGIPYERAAASA